MELRRSCGLLLPVTALPARGNCGDLGPGARDWINFCKSAGCSWWQILPFGPTGYGNSPYQCFSAFAGNPLWISAEELLADGLLSELPQLKAPPSSRINYATAAFENERMLASSWKLFIKNNPDNLRMEFDRFYEQHRGWLDDYALFMVIREQQQLRSWQEWPEPLRRREPAALFQIREQHGERLQQVCYEQWLFTRQWQKLHREALDRGVSIIGDLPLFVALDSADVWADPKLFKLDQDLQPPVVAGVPPDYFSPDGQRWGNPLFNWQQHIETGFEWWVARLRHTLEHVDLVRLDHFRGFEACWEVPADETHARNGHWEPAPGRELLQRFQQEFDRLPLLAEDLGLITEEVRKLRDDFQLPGMSIVQFAFDGDNTNSFLPHNHRQHSVAYTGTHDNDTTPGWWKGITSQQKKQVLEYLSTTAETVVDDLIAAVIASPAALAVIPLQDLLAQESSCRTNHPGSSSGNWEYRCQPEMLLTEPAEKLARLNKQYNRLAGSSG
jgi:4-alpha-glucanotransferase